MLLLLLGYIIHLRPAVVQPAAHTQKISPLTPCSNKYIKILTRFHLFTKVNKRTKLKNKTPIKKLEDHVLFRSDLVFSRHCSIFARFFLVWKFYFCYKFNLKAFSLIICLILFRTVFSLIFCLFFQHFSRRFVWPSGCVRKYIN